MIIRNLDENGDWTFGSGLADYLTGNPAIGLNIKTRILSWVGDCFFDLAAGIDWTNRLGKHGQKTLLDQDLRRIISQSYGVTGIISYDSSVTGRAFQANYSVNTIYSQAWIDSVTQNIGGQNA